MNLLEQVKMLSRYKAWANELTFGAVSALPGDEAIKKRETRFGSIVHTLNHVYVIDDIFKAHLLGESHGYTARNTPTHPPLHELWELQRAMDRWYVQYVDSMAEDTLAEVIQFQFVGGGEGVMSRCDMLMHVVNHNTYHRGFVGDMMYQASSGLPANDLPVFLRDHFQK